jgi:DNA-3-methyladenine glycosylase
VYRSHGLHWCLNVTSEPAGIGAAVLIRALAPRTGIEVMRARRGGVPDRSLADGPGKLTQALGITSREDGTPITADGPLRLEGGPATHDARRTVVTPRIGISRATDWPLRFVLLP